MDNNSYVARCSNQNDKQIPKTGHYYDILRRKINYWVHSAWMRYCRMIWMTNVEGCIRKQSWPMSIYIAAFIWIDWGKSIYNSLWTGRPWLPNERIHRPNVIPSLCSCTPANIDGQIKQKSPTTMKSIAVTIIIIYYNCFRSRKPKLTAVGIRFADHAAPSIR
jgi:hypothetical protein